MTFHRNNNFKYMRYCPYCKDFKRYLSKYSKNNKTKCIDCMESLGRHKKPYHCRTCKKLQEFRTNNLKELLEHFTTCEVFK